MNEIIKSIQKNFNNIHHLFDQKNIYIFAKDINAKYLFCNETVAEAAGLDSPAQIIGKTDKDLYWKKYADLYRQNEISVMNGRPFLNKHLPFASVQNNQAAILSTETILQDKNGNVSGIVGNCLDVTGYTISKNNGRVDHEKSIFHLGDFFNNAYFTRREFVVFKYLLVGKSVEEIALLLNRSVKTIQTQVSNIINKLQCSHKSEIAPTAIKHGLTHVISDFF